MPRTPQQNELAREESKARIIESALKLFGEHGYAHTSVRMIAQDAGIAQGLLYNYFASKEELLVAIFARSMHDVQESFISASEGTTPQEQLERLIEQSFAIVRRNRTFWKLSYNVRMQTAVLNTLGQDLFAWTSTIQQTLERIFRALGTAQPEIEAAILFALIDGICQHYVLDPDHYPLDQIARSIIEKYRK